MLFQTSHYNSFADKNINRKVKTIIVPRSKNCGEHRAILKKKPCQYPLQTFSSQKDDISVKEANMRQTHVTASTIHLAKGLEIWVIFISLSCQRSILHSRAEDTNGQVRF